MSKFPDPSYAKVVLEPIFEHMKENMFASMMEMNQAHLVMLYEQSLVNRAEFDAIVNSLNKITKEKIAGVVYDGSVEDLFFYIEQLLNQDIGVDTAGKLHTARSRNDMDITIYRMVLREWLLAFHEQLLNFQATLIKLIDEHKETIMTGYTHTQPAQATTLGHYFLALLDVLQRDTMRLESVYSRVNRSPMGAAAFTTTGFPISRERVQELLGFDSLVENSYDAIAGADYITESASTLAICALNLGRFVQDMLQWSTLEFNSIRVGDGFVQISSIMPQKRNPVSLEHSRALLSAVYGEALLVMNMVHNTPFGDIVDTEDDLQPHLWHAYKRGSKVISLLSQVMKSLTVNKQLLRKRINEDFCTVTELADTMVRQHQFSFRTAHQIVSKVFQEAYKQGLKVDEIKIEMIEKAAVEVTGNSYSFSEDLLKVLDPDHFVRLRSIIGGPAPMEVERMLIVRKMTHSKQQEWLTKQSDLLIEATHKREQLIQSHLGKQESM